MSKEVIRIGALGALVVVIISISPSIKTVANEASTEVYGIDILGLTTAAGDLPEHRYAAH
jgi:hypothetical protein